MILLGPNSIKDGLVILEILVDIVLEILLETLLEILLEIVEFAVIVGKILFVAEKVKVYDFVGEGVGVIVVVVVVEVLMQVSLNATQGEQLGSPHHAGKGHENVLPLISNSG